MERPVHATNHCRHYDYVRGVGPDSGPKCSLGVDLSAPGAWGCCVPEPKEVCASREEYTDEERAAWKRYTAHRMVMLGEAIDAIPEPIKPGTQGNTTCPHCAGFLQWTRTRNGHVWLQCSGPGCIGPVHFNVPADRPWPASKAVASG